MPSVLIRAPRRHRKHFVPRTIVRGSIGGSATLTFGDGNSTLTAHGVLAGAGAIAFTGSGFLATSTSIAGAAAIAFTGAGALQGHGALAGSAALVFTGLGTRSATASIAGSATLEFVGEGTLLVIAIPFIENVVRIRR